MTEMPLDPLLSKMLIMSGKYKCANEILTIVAMLNTPNVFIRPRDQAEAADREKSKFAHPDGDHLTLLNVFNTFKAKDMNPDWCWNSYLNFRALKAGNDIREQLIRIMVSQKCNLESNPVQDKDYYTNIKKCILSGFFM